jgi:hypothetical protein
MKAKGVEFRILHFTYYEPQHFDPDTQIIYIAIPKKEKVIDTAKYRIPNCKAIR